MFCHFVVLNNSHRPAKHRRAFSFHTKANGISANSNLIVLQSRVLNASNMASRQKIMSSAIIFFERAAPLCGAEIFNERSDYDKGVRYL